MASRTAEPELVAEEFREWILKFPGELSDLILSFFALVSGDIPGILRSRDCLLLRRTGMCLPTINI